MSWTPVMLYRPRTRCNGKIKSNDYRMEVECRGRQSCCIVDALDVMVRSKVMTIEWRWNVVDASHAVSSTH